MSGAMDEVFGPNRRRPDHPHFWVLSEIVLQMDGAIEAAQGEAREKVWKEMVSTHVDLDSITYLAFQRAIRRLGITTSPEVLAHWQEVASLSTVYIDGFIAGAAFTGKEGTKQ